MLYRFHSWGVFPEVLGAVLAQAETIFEKVNKTAETFGAGDDHFRLGMVIVFGAAVLLIGNYIAFKLFIALQTSTIVGLQTRAKELEKEIRDNRASYDVKYDEQREDFEKRLAAYWGTFDLAIKELAINNRWLQGQGYVPPPHVVPPVQLRAPPPSEAPPGRGTQFLPRTRRVPVRPEDEE